MKDVIIIGAGIAGLTAAMELKRRKKSFLILEGEAQAGGRARSITLPSGVAADLGAHWFHGNHTPLTDILDLYNIEYKKDEAKHAALYKKGKIKQIDIADWIDSAIDKKLAKRLAQDEARDRPLPELGKDAKSRKRLTVFARMWDGLTPPEMPSAKEFLSDESHPGGPQITSGMSTLIDRMVKTIGTEHLRLNASVKKITAGKKHVEVKAGGKHYTARAVLFTGSLGVLKSKSVQFEPPLSKKLRKHLDGIAMGAMNKIIVELPPDFFKKRKIEENWTLQLLDGYPHFCHVRSAGSPLINLFISGPRAKKIEKFTTKQAVAYLKDILAPVVELKGFEKKIIGKPIITGWFSNKHIRGSYSACLPGHTRSGPWQEDCLFFCGDTFDERFPGAMAGAFRSAIAAVSMINRFL